MFVTYSAAGILAGSRESQLTAWSSPPRLTGRFQFVYSQTTKWS